MRFAIGKVLGIALVLALSAPGSGAVSLWSDAGTYFSSSRDWHVGDIVTIVLDEGVMASDRLRGDRNRQWTVDATADATGTGAGDHNLFGRFMPFMNLDYQNELQQDNRYDRQTSVRSRFAAEVVNILPNGNLQLIARRNLRFNHEEQEITFHGTVTPENVNPDNTALSTDIADAEFVIDSTMRFSRSDRPSILERVTSILTGVFF